MFWELIDELQVDDPRIEEGTIMGGRGARVSGELLGLVGFKGSGLAVKLSKARAQELIGEGVGQPLAPAGKVLKEWVSIPKCDRRRWRSLLREGIDFVTRSDLALRAATRSTIDRPPSVGAMSDQQFTDEYGFTGPLPVTSTQRIVPTGDFPPGLPVGQTAPDFELPNHLGEPVAFHADRNGARAAVLFYRSAVW